jgi:uncharacterized protein YecT (DUF1311 family)
MKKKLKIISSAIITGVFLFFAFGSGSSDSNEKIKIDINDQKALEKYIQGKWSWEKETGDINHTWRYRFEIKGNKLRIWNCFNNTNDPFDMSEGYEEFNFTLGSPTRDVDGYKARYLEFALFDKTNFFGMTYESLSPFWLVSDDKWDTPVLRCSSGIPSWSREEFKSIGNRITHDDSNSDTEETTTESDYSTSNADSGVDKQKLVDTQEQNLEEKNNINLPETDDSELNQMQLNIKSGDKYVIVDKNLNDVYKQVMAVLTQSKKTALKHEQRNWIKLRDSICSKEGIGLEGGTMYTQVINNCLIEKTNERIKELNEILKSKE